MATRLQYSGAGFLRAMEMAQVGVIAIVEGGDDIYFYEKILDAYHAARARELKCQVRTPKEVRGAGDGKPAVLKLFAAARKKDRLTIHGSTKKSLVFFVDKDYDDFSRTRLRNPHLIYTPGVSIENAVIRGGDLRSSLEAIVGRALPQDRLGCLQDLGRWQVSCALGWIDWLIFCVACELSSVAPRRHRGNISQMHTGFPPVLEPTVKGALILDFEQGCGCATKAAAFLVRAEKLARRAIASGAVDRVFCGKWYGHFLRADVFALGLPYSARADRITKGDALRSHLLREFQLHPEDQNYFYGRLDAALLA